MRDGARVLYVDEDVLSARSAARVLEHSGYHVDLARNGEDALSALKSAHYDAVLTELLIADAKGSAFITAGHTLHPGLAFVVVTAHEAPEEHLDQVPENCVVGVLSKPWAPTDLLDLVGRAVRAGAQQRPRPPTRRSLLLLEDRPEQAELIRAYLKVAAPEYELTRAPSLRDAFTLLTRGCFDLVLTDLNLPDARGLDAVRRLLAAFSSLTVVAMSQSLDPAIGTQVLELGASDFLSKDELSPNTLKRILEHSLLRAEARRHLEDLAFRDGLTGLSNARYLRDRLGHAVSRAQRSGGTCGLVYIDLDGFKPVNDAHGHAAGDYVLQTVARRLSRELRSGDLLARVGGDEFAILLEGVESEASLTTVTNRLIDVIAEPIFWKQSTCHVSASAGIALCPTDADSPETLLRTADASMYEAKRLGPGRVLVAPRSVVAPVVDESQEASG